MNDPSFESDTVGSVTVQELKQRVDAGERVHLLDVRWQLGDPHGREQYLAGHLPGAVYVDLDTELAAPASAAGGRHPLPDPEVLQRAVRRWGLRTGQPVVVYGGPGGMSAARAWWLLRWAGVTDVELLDGGLDAWVSAGFPCETDDVEPEPGDVVIEPGRLPVLSMDDVAALPRTGVLLDVRPAERYRGEVEPLDARPGHIPGAISAPMGGTLAPDGTFLSADGLRERFATLGVAPGVEVGVSCGSGVSAAQTIYALHLAGIPAALYPGSWSQWAADPDRPAVVGPDPGLSTILD